MNMIEALRQLQSLDLHLDQLRDEANGGVSQLGVLKTELDTKKRIYDQAFDDLETLKKEKSALEETRSLEEVRVKKSRVRLNEIKNNFEYQALRREIDNTEKGNFQLDQQIKEKNEAITLKETALLELKNAYDLVLKSFQDMETEIAQKNSESTSFLQQKETERLEKEKHIEKSLLSKYAFIRRRHRMAVVEAVKGVCQGCHMSLPPQMANQMQKEGHFLCPHCNRFLFVGAKEGTT